MEEEKNVPVEEQSAAEAAEQTAPAVKMLTPEEIHGEIKPLSSNAFLAFFQKIWRWWLGVWYGFSDKHPKGAKLIYQIVFFLVFSNGVTIWQLLVMLFLPYAFIGIWDVPFVWPAADLGIVDALGNALNYAIFNEPVKFLTAAGETVLASTAEQVTAAAAVAGNELQMAGLGNFLAFEIAVFTAQCINLPLQRNITFKSKGNIWYQAMWYFIGWVGISIGVNALWGIMNPFMIWWNWNEAVIALLKTVITGGVSMLVFFPIFLIIFPDANKVEKKAKAKLEKLKASGTATEEQIAAAELNLTKKSEIALLFNTRSAKTTSISQANSRAVSFEAACRNLEKAKAQLAEAQAKAADFTGEDKAKIDETIAKVQEQVETIEKRIPDYQQKASEAIAAKHEAIEAYDKAIADVTAAKSARGEDVSKVA